MPTKTNTANENLGDNGSPITTYFHCWQCLKELPDGHSPLTYARYSIGQTADGGLCIWCNRHQTVMGIFSKIPRSSDRCDAPDCACNHQDA